MVRHLAADLRRPGRPDRGDAAQAGRREAVDRPAPVPARPELLHAAARPRGPAAGHLHRLAAQRHPRRTDRRHPVRAARDDRAARAHRRCTWPPATPTWSSASSPASAPPSSRSSSRPSTGSASGARPTRSWSRWPSRPSWRWPCSGSRSRSWSSAPACSAGCSAAGSRRCAAVAAHADDDGPPPLISDDALHPDLPSTAPRGPHHRASGWCSGSPRSSLVAAAVRPRQRLRRPGALLLRRRRGHLRRGVRGPRLRRPAGRRGLRLAGSRGDGPRTRARRDHAGARSSWSPSSSAVVGAYRDPGTARPLGGRCWSARCW